MTPSHTLANSSCHVDSMLYLSRTDIESLHLPFPEIVVAVETSFAARGRGEVESPPKRGMTPREGCSLRAMKAYIPSQDALGVKWISAFPPNSQRGLPTIHATVILNDIESGMPVAIMDGAWITAQRTAASTVVAARRLARSDSKSLGLIACGLQGEVNLRGLAGEFSLNEVLVYDLSPERAERFAQRMSKELGLSVQSVPTIRDVAAHCDLLVSSMPIERRPTPPIPAGWLKPGSFACLLDYDAALNGEALRAADQLVTDDLDQINFYRSIGYFRNTPEPDATLSKIVAQRQLGRISTDQSIVCMNLGVGFLDIVTAKLLYDRARASGAGTPLLR